MNRYSSICILGNAGVIVLLAAYVFFVPGCMLALDLTDPGLRNGEIPRFAFRWHRALSSGLERWARERVQSGSASRLNVNDISGTEWPVYSSVFYLWATESLQEVWTDKHIGKEPRISARNAIEAVAALVADPNHATWVKQHWGDDYLHHQNIFYRMLLISGLTSYQKLLGDRKYESLLREQVESLSSEMDASPHGLLEDYPGQCYPIDILPAVAAIRRADAVLGTNHSGFVKRALRGFEGSALDSRTGLPSYGADPKTGQGISPARGVGISYMLNWAPELWPDVAQEWFAKYDSLFWQESRLLAGFRELPKMLTLREWNLGDVDAGPVLAGYGTAASAFGIGAMRRVGNLQHAFALAGEALVAAWPLPSGTLLTARFLSNATDAPYVGEAILLFNFTRRPVGNIQPVPSWHLPAVVYAVIFLYLAIGFAITWLALSPLRLWRKHPDKWMTAKPPVRAVLWVILIIAGLTSFVFAHTAPGLLLLMFAQLLPPRL